MCLPRQVPIAGSAVGRKATSVDAAVGKLICQLDARQSCRWRKELTLIQRSVDREEYVVARSSHNLGIEQNARDSRLMSCGSSGQEAGHIEAQIPGLAVAATIPAASHAPSPEWQFSSEDGTP